ncbi:hypothetical protein QMZ92_00590 [Streptomyces sp. HNM0645]|uniref:hypothetical protein n=1 Tax=Streptomyces sp. HNM0645 TaxID=2782343 RepID=UPI0024B67AE6|nr:hypothetical protein [Streptomyces sp. HNM0645]MDI9882938.1 hypothetical protein [Streptomyces sp. HNM0645]
MSSISPTRKTANQSSGRWTTRSLSALAAVLVLGTANALPAQADTIPQAAASAPPAMFSGIANRHCAQWVDAPPNRSDWFCRSTLQGLSDEIGARGLHKLIDLYDFGSNHQLSVVSGSPASYCGHSTSYRLVPYLKDFTSYIPYTDCAPTFMSGSDASSASVKVGWPSSGVGQRSNHVRLGFSVGYMKLQFGWKESEARKVCVDSPGCTFEADTAEDTKWMPSEPLNGADIRNLGETESQTGTYSFSTTLSESREVSQTISKGIESELGLSKGVVSLGATVQASIENTYGTSWEESSTYTWETSVTVPPLSRIVAFVQRPATRYTGHYVLPTGQVVPQELVLPSGSASKRSALYSYVPQSLNERDPLVTPEQWNEQRFPTPTPVPTPTPRSEPPGRL